jgi:pilus assembly protein CpaF
MTPLPTPVSDLSSADLNKLKNFILSTVKSEVEGKEIAPDQQKAVVTQLIQEVYQRTRLNLNGATRESLFHTVLNELMGFGAIQPLLDDPDISEIMIVGTKKVFVERKGQLTKTQMVFDNENQILQIVDRIISPLGRRIDYDSPTVDARLPDGSRVNVVIRPCAVDGPLVTIRKFKKEKLSIEQLIEFGSISASSAEFLRACVVSRLNMIVAGGTGSGKTTFLNVLSSFIPDTQRIVTIEDTAELQLQQDHVARLETKNANSDQSGAVTIRDLVKNALRMRPDRIIIGECRGEEALDMLQAMNTGHDGSLTTLHANTPRDVLSRLETMIMMAGMDLPLKTVRQQISSAVDVVVQQTRMRDGSRKVTSITEVAGMEGETIIMSEIFKFEQTSLSPEGKIIGQMKPTGIRPLFGPRLEVAGFKLSPEMFGATIADIRMGLNKPDHRDNRR